MNTEFGTLLMTASTMFIPGLYGLGLDKFLYKEKWSKYIEIITLLFVVIGIVIVLFFHENYFEFGVSVSFFSPIYHLWLFRFLRNFFIRINKREPIDVAFNFKSGLINDRIFALFFTLFSIFSSFAVVSIFFVNNQS